MPDVSASDEPRLRADAQRNRARILAAASEVFAERGTDASADEIAARAGVGHATVFRHFPTKDDLIVAILEARVGDLTRVAEEAAAGPDAWTGLRRVIEFCAERYGEDRCIIEAAGVDPVAASERLREAKAGFHEPVHALFRRAQAEGQLREDLEPEDLWALLTAALRAVPPGAAGGDLWRRYLGVIVDGMRPEGASPLPATATSPLQISSSSPPPPGSRASSSTSRSSSSGE
jgi:AcrR family transcriptional regulator